MTEGTAHYYLVKLVKGPEWRPGLSFDLLLLQFRHLRNLLRLRRFKKTVISGPLMDDGDVRGVVMFKVGTEDEVRKLIETDPAVQAGRLSYEISEF